MSTVAGSIYQLHTVCHPVVSDLMEQLLIHSFDGSIVINVPSSILGAKDTAMSEAKSSLSGS